ncbi:rnf-145 [Pristionchus pacificus]|uniref:Zinc finger protein n=1 Tax=Pristionchus pacificus TaxID=54126 RepID=A0A2A6BKM1_PRIPA|nr:rnf-145 [Pristionchus pacificus]|eukprot:PDM66437.1 zinc finger protein [Pristionchus pacificus]
MDAIRDRMVHEFQQFDLNDLRVNGRQRVHASVELLKTLTLTVAEIALRLPGLLMLELWWRSRGATFDEMAEGMLQGMPVPFPSFRSFFDMNAILDFVHSRQVESTAATVISVSVLFFSFAFLALSLQHVLRLYAHFASIILFGVAHSMSTTYVTLEESSGVEELKLDDFVKLERHGFHFLAQLLLAVLQATLLGLQSDIGRVCLAFYTAPIVARMCSFPLSNLMFVHNCSCSLTMFSIMVYVMFGVPRFWESIIEGGGTIRTLLATRGLAVGAASIWRRLRLSELLTWAWLVIFAARCYMEMVEKGRSWRETWPVILEGIAETTNTPITMLALALTVSHVCAWALRAVKWFIAAHSWQPQHVLAHSSYMELGLLLMVCTQTGLLGMKNEQKAALLGLVLFIVLSALLHTLFDLVNTQLQILATSRDMARFRHMRTLSTCCALIPACAATASTAYAYLPMDLWTCVLLSNCFITAVHAASAIVQYLIARAEATSESWMMADSANFACDVLTKLLEVGCTMFVIAVGSWVTVNGEWTVASFGVLLLQVVFNVIQKIDIMCELFRKRSEAQANLERLAVASDEQIRENADVCAICLQEMTEGQVRVTPCTHLFHSPCLKKWLSVKQVCPLCYSDMAVKKHASSRATSRSGSIAESDGRPQVRRRPRAGQRIEGEDLQRELDRINRQLDGARDFWPLIGINYDSEDFESDGELVNAADDELPPVPDGI